MDLHNKSGLSLQEHSKKIGCSKFYLCQLRLGGIKSMRQDKIEIFEKAGISIPEKFHYSKIHKTEHKKKYESMEEIDGLTHTPELAMRALALGALKYGKIINRKSHLWRPCRTCEHRTDSGSRESWKPCENCNKKLKKLKKN